MIKKWYALKKKEIELKLVLYTYAAALLENKKDIVRLLTNLYLSLKDTKPDELQATLIAAIAELVHKDHTAE